MQRHQQIIQVSEEDLDELEHVNNIRYIEWIQTISREHWLLVTENRHKNELLWVVRKHDITYYSSAKLKDELSITTFIEGFKGPISTRIVEIKNNNTGDLVVKSITDWCLIDSGNMKPKRIPESLVNLFL